MTDNKGMFSGLQDKVRDKKKSLLSELESKKYSELMKYNEDILELRQKVEDGGITQYKYEIHFGNITNDQIEDLINVFSEFTGVGGLDVSLSDDKVNIKNLPTSMLGLTDYTFISDKKSFKILFSSIKNFDFLSYLNDEHNNTNIINHLLGSDYNVYDVFFENIVLSCAGEGMHELWSKQYMDGSRITFYDDKKNPWPILFDIDDNLISSRKGDGVDFDLSSLDKKSMLSILKEHSNYFEYCSKDLKKDKSFVLKALKSGGDFEYVDESLRGDKEVVLEAIKQDGDALAHADASLKKDKEVVLEAIKQDGDALAHADKAFQKDKEIVLKAVKKSGTNLAHADASLQKDKEVVLEAIKQDGVALQFADKSLQKDKEIVLEAIKNSEYGVLEFADKSLQKDKEIVLESVKTDGRELEYADKSLQEDKEVILTAVKQNEDAVQYAVITDKELALSLISICSPHENWEEYLGKKSLFRSSLFKDKDIQKAIEKRKEEED